MSKPAVGICEKLSHKAAAPTYRLVSAFVFRSIASCIIHQVSL